MYVILPTKYLIIFYITGQENRGARAQEGTEARREGAQGEEGEDPEGAGGEGEGRPRGPDGHGRHGRHARGDARRRRHGRHGRHGGPRRPPQRPRVDGVHDGPGMMTRNYVTFSTPFSSVHLMPYSSIDEMTLDAPKINASSQVKFRTLD